jgi:Zn-dependent protease with chaperone function
MHQLKAGGAAIAEMLGGKLVSPKTQNLREKRLLNLVEEMTLASGIPVPAVYLLENEISINAFAAGLTPEQAVIGVTDGALKKPDRDELQGVIAHEFSHIFNGDMRLNLMSTELRGASPTVKNVSVSGQIVDFRLRRRGF